VSDGTPFPQTLALRCGPISAVDLALFAAASGDHNPLHLDAAVARAAGFERPVVHGMYTMACAARLFTQAFGAGCVQALQTRFTGVALVGDTIEFVAERSNVQARDAQYKINARTAAGAEVLSGTARVRHTP
jgi:acyl dehydratase